MTLLKLSTNTSGSQQRTFEQKKSPLMKAGLKLFSWRRIVETGVIMLQRHIYV
jgi:hypothetical protein